MTKDLTPHQKEALDNYFGVIKAFPDLVAGRPSRPIILDRERLETFARETGAVLGLAASTKYVYFINDLVEGRTVHGEPFPHPYFRVVYPLQLAGAVNTVILGTVEDAELGSIGSVVLVEQARHATGSTELELPRGFGERDLSGEQNAIKELQEETGFIGTSATFLGRTATDSGMTDSYVSFFHIPITGIAREGQENGEKDPIENVRLLPLEDVWALIVDGTIHDAFTLQALSLFSRRFEK